MFFFENYTVGSVLAVIGLLGLMLFFNEVTRRNKKAAVLVFIVFPILATLFVWSKTAGAGTSGGYWFAWVKTYSALAGVIGFMAIRYIKTVRENKYFRYFPFAILSVNILEAVFRDIEVYSMAGQVENGITLLGGPWNLINAVAGILVILTLTGWAKIRVANTESQDMIWADQLWFWIIGYDLWNLAYVYNCISDRAMYAGVLLIVACTVAEVFKRGAWLQHRAATLAIWAMFSLTMNYAQYPAFQIQSTHDPKALMLLSVAALVFNAGVFGYQIFTMMKTKRNPIASDLYVGLKAYQKNLSANGLTIDADTSGKRTKKSSKRIS